ncbi:MAG: ABC-2 family transporter protein [Patescibacteria group bacterium]|nr:ABC-2 family transporter protein [Patescibacteria group bacterium]
MKKYWAVFKVNLMRQYEHRFDNLFWFFCGLLPAFVNYVTWVAVYGDKKEINGFQQTDLLTYFLVMAILWYIIGGTVSKYLGSSIKDGGISAFIVKPIHPILRYIFIEQGWKLGSLILIAPIFIVLLIVFNLKIPITSIEQLLFLLVSMILGATIFSLWDMIIGMCAFFIQNVDPISRLNRILFMLLSGQVFPVVLMPAWMAGINNLLFYRYTFAFSADIIFTPDEINLPFMFGMQALWVILIIIIFKLLYKFGIKKYEAYGA